MHEAVLAAGETETGATVHMVNEVPDGGRILMQQRVPVFASGHASNLAAPRDEQAEWVHAATCGGADLRGLD